MFLRSLTLRGFKSFAEKTTLEFTPGISVVVGPNGSGKSNISDALAWVLGEQGPRALRGTQMSDVIFAGSPARQPLGLAEVKLVIDNSAGLIPVPASEIEISRAVFRSGESEYRLGGRPCRLMDIQELLSDTGVGRTLHTIIGQGQLEAVLAARPEERRAFIEEAAGIAKHRRRRERAERKLAGLEGDLLRLQDLVGELRRHLKPLKQQAELAERHDALTREAQELAVRLAASRLRELFRDRDRRRPSWLRAEERQAEARGRLDELDAAIARLEAERAEAVAAASEAEAGHIAALGCRTDAETGLRAAMRAEARAAERLSAASGRSGRLFALEEELERTEKALEDVGASMQRREAELEQGEAAFRRAEQDRRDAEGERRLHEQRLAAHRADTEALRRSLAADESELARLAVTLREVRDRGRRSSLRAAELEAEIERLDEVETPLARRQAALHDERESVAAGLAQLEAREAALLARQEVVEARREELSESPAESFAGRRERALGVLRTLVAVPAELGPALRAALGALADSVVYASHDEALADVRAEGAGGLVLAVSGGAPAEPRTKLSGERSLCDLVRPDPRVRDLVARALEGVYLVHNLAEAAAKGRVHPEASFVTPDGALVGPTVVRPPAGPDGRLEDVRRASAALDRELAGIRRELREGRARLGELRMRAEEVRTGLEQADALITAAAEELNSVRAESSSAAREEQRLVERLAVVEASAASGRARLAQAPPVEQDLRPLPPAPEAPVHLRVEVEALRRERGRLDAGVARARREISALAAEDPVMLRRDVESAGRERALAEEGLRDAEAALEAVTEAYRVATERSRRAQAHHDEANQAWREQAAAVDRMRAEHEEEDRARLDLERRIAEAERVLREGHDADPAAAVAGLAEDETVQDLQQRADAVARRLGLLGRVNLRATGELEELQSRHDFLVRELDDVRKARADLHHVIREVDLRVAELFESAFRDVSREFAELFARLFPGGEGRLTLLDPGQPLTSGIEVEARPGRKRVKRLSLLSGGERSLAALAFLFAIFRARPSPFYLMDEVEAALDDVNLLRFLEVLREFGERSQVLVVTHQKRTMETADVLYGVSMGREGVSTVISQRLAEVAAG